MTLDENFELADVTKDGTVFMGKTVTCDGYDFNRKNAAIKNRGKISGI